MNCCTQLHNYLQPPYLVGSGQHKGKKTSEGGRQVILPLFPIGSVLTDIGLFNRPFGHFESVWVCFCQNVCFYSNLGTK